MIEGIGLDITEIERIEAAYTKNESFAARVLTESERVLFEPLTGNRKMEFLAGRFAAKEAFSKAYGTGIGKLSFQDIEILKGERGQPVVTRSPYVGTVWVSISHSKENAVAQVILENRKGE